MVKHRKKQRMKFQVGVPGAFVGEYEIEYEVEWESDGNAIATKNNAVKLSTNRRKTHTISTTINGFSPVVGQLGELISGFLSDKDFQGYYCVIAKHSGKALDVQEANKGDCANVFQHSWHGLDNQQWIFVRAKDGYYHIFAKHSGKVLDVQDASTHDGANVFQYHLHGGDNQKWKLQKTRDGYFHIINKHSGKVLDVQDASTHDGANVFQYHLHGKDNQKWKLQPAKQQQ